MTSEMSTMPEYLFADVNNLKAIENTPLRAKASYLTFPLNAEDLRQINSLAKKLRSDKKIVGLAAPQFGISKRIIMFEIPEDDDNEAVLRTILINPTYDRVTNERVREHEQCETVRGMTGPVRRYRRIRYKAYNLLGKPVEGEAEGFLARVIQHEIDHLDGKLYIDRVPQGRLVSLREHLWQSEMLGENDTDQEIYGYDYK